MSENQITQRRQETPATRMEAFLNKPAVMKRLAQFARNNVKPETMIRLAVVAVSQDEWLSKCSPESVYLSLIVAAQIGLEPSGVRGEAYLVPFKGKCTLIPGWRGLIKLALRSKAVRSVYSHIVYEGDDFVVSLGTDVKIHHRPALNNDADRQVIAAYAVAILENGAVDVEVMDRLELERIRSFAASSRGGKDGPAYSQWADQMYRKAPIRRLCKRLPLGDDYFVASKLEDIADEGGDQSKIGAFIDLPPEAVDEQTQSTSRIASAVSKVGDDRPRASSVHAIEVRRKSLFGAMTWTVEDGLTVATAEDIKATIEQAGPSSWAWAVFKAGTQAADGEASSLSDAKAAAIAEAAKL